METEISKHYSKQQLQFCKNVVEIGHTFNSKLEAYLDAYPKQTKVKSSLLQQRINSMMSNPKIQRKIKEIRKSYNQERTHLADYDEEWNITKKQKDFCELLVNLKTLHKKFTLGEAYNLAFNKHLGMMEANQRARGVIENFNVRMYLNHLRSTLIESLNINTEFLTHQLLGLLDKNVADVMLQVGDNIQLKSFDDMDVDTLNFIKSVKQSARGDLSIETYDKTRIIELLAKLVGSIDETAKVKTKVNVKFSDMTTDELKKVREILKKKKDAK